MKRHCVNQYQVSLGVNVWDYSEVLENIGTGWREVQSYTYLTGGQSLANREVRFWELEKDWLIMAEKWATLSIEVRYLAQGCWPRAMDSPQILIWKSKISGLGQIIMMGMAVTEQMLGGWICKHSLLSLPVPGTPDSAPCLDDLFPGLPTACQLPVLQCLFFRDLSCWPLTHLHR